MTYSYKRLTSSNLPVVRGLLNVFGEAFEEPDTYQGKPPSDIYLKSLLVKDHIIVVTAQNENEVVGGLIAYVLEKFEQERKEIYIYDLAVLKAHCRRGIATTLIQELIKIGKGSGAYVIFVQADQGDKPAIKLYESLGKREDVFNFDIPV